MQTLITRAIMLWFLFIPVAIINGMIRERVYRRYVGELLAHQISTVVAIILLLILSYFIWNQVIDEASILQLLSVGILMVSLTVLFEFGFGYFVDKASWERLFHDYNIFQGRLWILFLITELLSPIGIKLLYGR